MTWKSTRLVDITDLITKGTTPTTLGFDFAEHGIPFLRVQNIENGKVIYERGTLYIDRRTHEALKRSHIKASDVLISIAGTIGRAALVPEDAPSLNCNQAVAIVRPTQEIFRPFLRFWLESPGAQRQMRASVVTGTISNLSLTQLGNLQVPLPPLAEQRRIAEILERAEALRFKRRAALAQLDSLTQSFFLSLFGDPMKPSKRWRTATFGEFATHMAYGPRFYNEEYSSDGIRIIRITDLDDAGSLNFDVMPRMSVDASAEAKYSLQAGDVLFARSGSVGKSAVLPEDAPKCIAGAYFIVMRFAPEVRSTFARSVINAPSVQKFIQVRSRQAIQPNFSGPGVRALPLPLPPLELQCEFERQVWAVEKLKAAQLASLTELNGLFASLQHRAFHGKL